MTPVAKCRIAAAIVAASLVSTSPLVSTALAAPISGVTVSSTIGSCCNAFLENIVNGSGLSSYNPSATHSAGDNWIGTSKTGTIDFNLNGAYLLEGVAVFNTAFGVSQYELALSTDGFVFTSIAGFPVTLANPPSGSITTSEVQLFSPTPATHVRMTLLNGYSSSNNTGLKEVIFLGTPIPEPHCLALASLAALTLSGTQRRMRTANR